jgi:hypothetical protein
VGATYRLQWELRCDKYASVYSGHCASGTFTPIGNWAFDADELGGIIPLYTYRQLQTGKTMFQCEVTVTGINVRGSRQLKTNMKASPTAGELAAFRTITKVTCRFALMQLHQKPRRKTGISRIFTPCPALRLGGTRA